MIAHLLTCLWDIQGLTCRETIRISANALERSLTFRERVKLSLHQLLCARCRNYGRQLTLMRKWLRRMSEPDAVPTGMAILGYSLAHKGSAG